MNRTTDKGRPKKKPDYNAESIMQEFFSAVSESYLTGSALGGGGRSSAASLRRVADEFGITLMKARKLLITAGAYHTEISDEVNKLRAEGKSIEQIMEFTGLKRSSVHSYLPYSKSVYNLNEISLCAERCRLYRQRKKAEEISHCRKLFSVRVKSAVPKDLAYMGQAICIRCLYVSG